MVTMKETVIIRSISVRSFLIMRHTGTQNRVKSRRMKTGLSARSRILMNCFDEESKERPMSLIMQSNESRVSELLETVVTGEKVALR